MDCFDFCPDTLYYRVVLNGGLPTDRRIPYYEITRRIQQSLAASL